MGEIQQLFVEGVWREKVKPGFAWSVSILMVEVTSMVLISVSS
jgi:hypothetical protein